VLGVANLTATQYSPEYAVLDVARTQLPNVVADEAEQQQLRNAIEGHRHKPIEEELTYEEFRSALLPYCKLAGEFPEQSATAVMLDRTEWREVLALDLSTIDKSQKKDQIKPIPHPTGQIVTPDKGVGVRDCPNCGKSIDRRATFCIHCQKIVAQHVPCPNCQEPRVPDDLDFCWKCGLKMREEEKIECPRCFSWRGYENEFPCTVCGFDPKADPAQEAGGDASSPSDSATGQNAAGAGASHDPAAAPPPEPSLPLVQCPTCYSMVEPGPRCSVCEGLLETG
jgi:predicted RNA-binding Zn-ribbon protein involved in translation (DUF1610 family)